MDPVEEKKVPFGSNSARKSARLGAKNAGYGSYEASTESSSSSIDSHSVQERYTTHMEHHCEAERPSRKRNSWSNMAASSQNGSGGACTKEKCVSFASTSASKSSSSPSSSSSAHASSSRKSKTTRRTSATDPVSDNHAVGGSSCTSLSSDEDSVAVSEGTDRVLDHHLLHPCCCDIDEDDQPDAESHLPASEASSSSSGTQNREQHAAVHSKEGGTTCTQGYHALRYQEIATENFMIFPPVPDSLKGYRGLLAVLAREPHPDEEIKSAFRSQLLDSEWTMKPLPGTWEEEYQETVESMLGHEKELKQREPRESSNKGGECESEEMKLFHQLYTNPLMLVPYEFSRSYHVPVFAHEVDDILRLQNDPVASMVAFFDPFNSFLTHIFVNDAALRLLNVEKSNLRYAFAVQGPTKLWAEEDTARFSETLIRALLERKKKIEMPLRFIGVANDGGLSLGSSFARISISYLPTGSPRMIKYRILPPEHSTSTVVPAHNFPTPDTLSESDIVRKLAHQMLQSEEMSRRYGRTAISFRGRQEGAPQCHRLEQEKHCDDDNCRECKRQRQE
eukprot:gb/GECG01006198.1/.p1 GENE.gb/GECG01006198.1/~~gb/GECG01006198.1/.p1  ORF type:complete len:564 (+),score=73.94 gb/GECG01006198.1/:1-1692(+)